MPFVTLASASQAPADGEVARYDVDGTAIAAANVGGAPPTEPLSTYDLQVEDDKLQIEL